MSSEIVCQECGNPEPDNLGSRQVGKYVYDKYHCNGARGDGCHDWIFKIDPKTNELMTSSLSPCIQCGTNSVYKTGESKGDRGTTIFEYECKGCGLTAKREYGPEIDRIIYDLPPLFQD